MAQKEPAEANDARQFIQGVLETVREPLLILDEHLRVLSASASFCRIFQIEPEQVENWLLYEMQNHQWDIPGLRALLDGVLRKETPVLDLEVLHPLPRPGERTLVLNARPIPSAQDAPNQILLAIEDVTECRRTEHALRESRDRLSAILDTAADAVVSIGEDGIVFAANASAERMFGYVTGELLGQNVKILMPSPHRERHDHYLERYLNTGEAKLIGDHRELTARRRDGSTFPVDVAVSKHHDGLQWLFTAIIRDVSDRKELQRQLLEIAAEEDGRIGQELHDSIQQELTGLGLLAQNLVETLSEKADDGSRAAARIAMGISEVNQHIRLLAHGLVPVEVDACGLASSLAELAADTTQLHDVTCEFQSCEPVEVHDNFVATHLFRMAQEAVTNALKHARTNSIVISLQKAGDLLTLRVLDNGVGIDHKKGKGPGMGLRIMAYRAGLIGCNLTAAVRDEGGTAVTCTVNLNTVDDQPGTTVAG